MNIRAIVSILFCAVLLVACSACCSRESMVPNGMTAAELVAAALAAEEEIDNYQFNGVVIGAMTGGTTTVVDVSGIVDEQNRALHINMSHTGHNESMQLYVVDNWEYINVYGPNLSSTWNITPVTEDTWWVRNLPMQQVNALHNFIQVNYIGTETIGGIECYKLEVEPDLVQVLQWFTGEADMGELDPSIDVSDMVSGQSLTVWVAIDTNYIVQTVIEATLSVDLEYMVMSIGQSISTTRSQVNQPVSIELPPDIGDAD
jgi:hypothetical protein